MTVLILACNDRYALASPPTFFWVLLDGWLVEAGTDPVVSVVHYVVDGRGGVAVVDWPRGTASIPLRYTLT